MIGAQSSPGPTKGKGQVCGHGMDSGGVAGALCRCQTPSRAASGDGHRLCCGLRLRRSTGALGRIGRRSRPSARRPVRRPAQRGARWRALRQPSGRGVRVWRRSLRGRGGRGLHELRDRLRRLPVLRRPRLRRRRELHFLRGRLLSGVLRLRGLLLRLRLRPRHRRGLPELRVGLRPVLLRQRNLRSRRGLRFLRRRLRPLLSNQHGSPTAVFHRLVERRVGATAALR